MAFTDIQREQVFQYLGFQAEAEEKCQRFVAMRADIESKMDEIGADATKQATVTDLLTKIAAAEVAVFTSGTAIAAMGSLKKADEVEFYQALAGGIGGTLTNVQYGELLLSRLAARFGYAISELPSDYFRRAGILNAGVSSYPRREWDGWGCGRE